MKLSESLTHIIEIDTTQWEKRFVVENKEAAEVLSDFLYKQKLGGTFYGPYTNGKDKKTWYEVSIYKS